MSHVERRDRDFAAAFLEDGDLGGGPVRYFAIEQAMFGLAGLTSARRSFGNTTKPTSSILELQP